MSGRLRIAALKAGIAGFAMLLLAGCADSPVHGSAGGSATDHGNIEHIRIGLPF